MATILVIDDEEQMCEMLSSFLRRRGHEPSCARTLTEGVQMAQGGQYDVVFLDVRLPDGNGLAALPAIKAASSLPEVIIMTGRADSEGAQLAIGSGAWDYFKKGGSLSEVSLSLARALQYRERKKPTQPVMSFRREKIIGDSPRLKMCLSLAAQAARHDTNVLLTGETGTGKELFALAIHENSPRANGHFVVVDCAALPESLVESLLFGHEKGAFTGAESSHAGLIGQANGGTLFLDEVGELSLDIQKAFLRVLQERRFRPVGSENEMSSDFRLIASTNRDLEAMVEEGRFRDDLLFRLHAFGIEIPPLRERKKDIPAIAKETVTQICSNFNIEALECSPEFLEDLMEYDWPGNVRQLVHSLEQAASLASGEKVLYRNHLPVQIRVHLANKAIQSPLHGMEEGLEERLDSLDPPFGSLREAREAAEKNYLQHLLSATNGDLRETCRMAGVSRSHLYGLLGKYGLSGK